MEDWGRLLALLGGRVERGLSMTRRVKGRPWRQVEAVAVGQLGRRERKGCEVFEMIEAGRVAADVGCWKGNGRSESSGFVLLGGTQREETKPTVGYVRLGKVRLRAVWSRDRSDRRVPASVSEWQFPGGETQQAAGGIGGTPRSGSSRSVWSTRVLQR